MKRLLHLRQVSHGYREAGAWRTVLRGVDLDVDEGEQLALIGQSGSGKSTLMHLIGGLDLPQAGTIRFGETDLAALGEPARTLWRRQVGFIYQFFNLIPTLPVRRMIAKAFLSVVPAMISPESVR